MLTAMLAIVSIVGAAAVASGVGSSCSQAKLLAGECTTTVSGGLSGDAAVLQGFGGSPGSSGSGGTGGSPLPEPGDPNCLYVLSGRCFAVGPARAATVAPLTFADIAAFRPVPGVDRMEPNGWMLVGLETNFFSTGAAQVHDGTLLGSPASVRFTPVAWHWAYGDGTIADRDTGGAAWASLGVPEFSSTATSHIFRAPGTYTIDLTIEFRAEYRFGSAQWTAITGTLAVPANRLVVVAGDARTVLVGRECTVDSTGPGC